MKKKMHGSGWRVDLQTNIGTMMPIGMFSKESDARLFSEGMTKRNKVSVIKEVW